METKIEREVDLQLVLSPERSIDVPARLTYRTGDPYAVHMAFHIGSEAPVHWTFARDLLLEGLFRPCGSGDVRVWPTQTRSRTVLCLALSSPDGDALLEIASPVVSSWLERTLRAVPPGQEAEHLGLEETLDVLLSPTPDHRSHPDGHAYGQASDDPGAEDCGS